MAIDIAPLWDFSRPDESERRFTAAMATAAGDDRLILATQVARTHGLRRDFTHALALLDTLVPQVAGAGPEARAWFALERGRARVSATHLPAQRSSEARALARADYLAAVQWAREAGRDGLAIDALHMLAFVDDTPAEQLRWAQEALVIAERSAQPEAARWRAPLLNNAGCALHAMGRYPEALEVFERALVWREQNGQAGATRVARWMVAWTLRALDRPDEAIAIQLRLEREWDEAGAPDPFVFDELVLLYRQLGVDNRVALYAARREAVK